MKRSLATVAVCCLSNIPAFSQPAVNSVLHAASLRPAQFAFSSVPQGALAVATGSRLGPATLEQAKTYPLQTELAGTSVKITSGAVTVNALMIYALDRQVAFVVPSATPLGPAKLSVTYQGQTSAPADVLIVRSNLGVYTWPQDGSGPGIATDATTGALITVQAPAQPGQEIVIWANGLGPITGDETQPPPAGDLASDVTAWVGARQSQIRYHGRSPCCTGLDQINLQVPSGAPNGCYVPMYFKSESAGFISNITTIPITQNGAPCDNPLGIPALSLSGKDHVVTGLMLLERNFNRDSSGSISAADFLHMIYVRTDETYFNNAETVNHLGSFAPGTCSVQQSDNSAGYDPLHQSLLDAGPAVTLTLGGNTFRFPHDDFGGYGAFIQGQSPLDFSGAGSLTNGAGAQVPAFNLTFNTPALADFQWSEQTTLSSINIGEPLTLTWTGAASGGLVIISGGSNTPALNMTFTCAVSGAQTSFAIPSDVTRFIPAGPGFVNVSYRQPVAVSGFPAGLDGLRYERQVSRSTGVSFR
jgi:uncharacterized protein (TIGR03437 family)